MNLQFRPPAAAEWRVCRMLLPETFARAAAREYVLCLREDPPRIAGAAAFCRKGDRISDFRLHVVPSFRRLGIGRRLLDRVTRSAAVVQGTSEITAEPGAEAFCLRAGFRRVDALTTVEGDIGAMRDYMAGLRSRLGPLSGAAIVRLPEASPAEVARLHAQYVVHDDLNPWRTLVANSPSMSQSPVAMVDGRVVGMLLWEMKDGKAVVASRVAQPGPWSKWVNAALLADGLDGAWNAGARRVRFSYTGSNHDTRKLAARFQAETVAVLAQFERATAPEPPGTRPSGATGTTATPPSAHTSADRARP